MNIKFKASSNVAVILVIFPFRRSGMFYIDRRL